MEIYISIPNRPSLNADVDFPPRPGEMLVVEHDYYRVSSVCWTWNVVTGMRVRVSVVDMHEADKGWRGWAYAALYTLALVGIATLVAWGTVGLR